jgi:hypothetical protein
MTTCAVGVNCFFNITTCAVGANGLQLRGTHGQKNVCVTVHALSFFTEISVD